ncbi:hypothetical protein SRHO_G00101380 [Serrasalmus rhombeus]
MVNLCTPCPCVLLRPTDLQEDRMTQAITLSRKQPYLTPLYFQLGSLALDCIRCLVKTRNTIQTQLRPGSQTATASSCAPSAPAEAASTHGNPDTAALKLGTILLRSSKSNSQKATRDTLSDVLSTIQLNLQAVKTQLAHDKAANIAAMCKLKGTVGEMEHALTKCSDNIATMKATIESLTANLAKLENKCEDLEFRSQRNNIRILGVPEGPDTCTTAAIAAMLKEAFGLVKETLLDRSHRTLQPKPKPGDRPRVIVCRFHYHSDCVDILRRARELRQIKLRDQIISIFPDYTAKVARARAAFNEVRRRYVKTLMSE